MRHTSKTSLSLKTFCCIIPVVCFNLSAEATTQEGNQDKSKPMTYPECPWHPGDRAVLRLKSGQELPLAYIPPGEFKMGSKRYAPSDSILAGVMWLYLNSPSNEGPIRSTKITKNLFALTTKIPTSLYCDFLNSVQDADRYVSLNRFSRIVLDDNDGYTPTPGCESAAANTVTWDGANAFTQWVAQETGLAVRLPTEAEWEYIARGSEGRRYPWGDEYELNTKYRPPINHEKNIEECKPVDAYPAGATPEGVMGLWNNGEWVSDYYADSYEPKDNVDPTGPPNGKHRVVRLPQSVITRRFPGPIGFSPDGAWTFRFVIEVVNPCGDR